MKHGTWYVAVAIAGMWLGAACSSEEPPGSQGQTHWLRECANDGDCGELSCECGRCVAGCDDGASCDVAGRSTTCQAASSGAVTALCGGQRASAMCLEPCGAGCEDGERCVANACIPALSSGTAGSAGGAGQGESGRGGSGATSGGGRGGSTAGGGGSGAGGAGTGSGGNGGAGTGSAGRGGSGGSAGSEPDPGGQDGGLACLPRAQRCDPGDDQCCTGSRCVQTACTASIPPSCTGECMPDSVVGKPDAGSGGDAPCGPTLRCNRATEVCIAHHAFMTTYACRPIPAGCGAKPTCECTVDTLCNPGFKTCNDEDPAEIACICIAC